MNYQKHTNCFYRNWYKLIIKHIKSQFNIVQYWLWRLLLLLPRGETRETFNTLSLLPTEWKQHSPTYYQTDTPFPLSACCWQWNHYSKITRSKNYTRWRNQADQYRNDACVLQWPNKRTKENSFSVTDNLCVFELNMKYILHFVVKIYKFVYETFV